MAVKYTYYLLNCAACSWLYNLFDSTIERRIKDELDSKICALVTNNIEEAVNKALESAFGKYTATSCFVHAWHCDHNYVRTLHAVTVSIDKVAKLSYALINKPTFTPWLVMTDHKVRYHSCVPGHRIPPIPNMILIHCNVALPGLG